MARILVLEDDDLLREVLVQVLERASHTVISANNGELGLRLFRSQPFDLVLTDLVMPVQEGVETIQALRKLSPPLPIIAMSGGIPHADVYLNIAGRLGATRVLAKPFTPQKLLDEVAEVLGGTSAM